MAMANITGLNIIENKIMEYVKECKKSPTTYEIQKKVKVSWSTVDKYGYKLEKKGHITIEEVFDDNGRKKIYWHLTDKGKD